MVECTEQESSLHLHNDVVDWNVNELDKESNKAHHSKSHSRGQGNPLEL